MEANLTVAQAFVCQLMMLVAYMTLSKADSARVKNSSGGEHQRNLRWPYDRGSNINNSAHGADNAHHREPSEVLEYVHWDDCIGCL